jgi:peptidoglycan/xylan/chitin deacetylase (PgdA/CDA1 family)
LRSPNQLPSLVLMYHRIGSPLVRSIVRQQYVLPSLFRSQIQTLLARDYKPLTLSRMLSCPDLATGHFCVTFDDGYSNVKRLAFPILVEMGVPATVFVVTDCVGKTNEWDELKGDRTEGILGVEDLREMALSGWEIGSHTITHPHLTELSDDALREEVAGSKTAIEEDLNLPVTSFAYPYGDWDQRVHQAVADAGYSYAVTTNRGVVTTSGDPLSIPRINMRWNTYGGLLLRKIGKAQRLHPVGTTANLEGR